MVNNSSYKTEVFSTCSEDKPLFVQFAGDDPLKMLEAAKLVQDKCDAVDINFGCPQV